MELDASATAQTKRLRILLVEDHNDTRQIMVRLLRKLEHEVEAAPCVESALTAASQMTFDLVISDLGLPDGSGIDLMRLLRDRYGLKGIALTGFDDHEEQHRTKDAGFQQHLTKPIDFQRLQDVIRDMEL